MDERTPYTLSPEERAARRAERIAERRERERKERQQMLRRLVPAMALGLAVIAVAVFGLVSRGGEPAPEEPEDLLQEPVMSTQPEIPEETPPPEPVGPYSLPITATTPYMTLDTVDSGYAILIDLENNVILAQKGAQTVISPASMTKILTVLVAAEHIDDAAMLDDTVTIDLEITNYSFSNDCSVAGFELNEPVPVRELFYGTILPSGAEAALALARYTAGGHSAFVTLMNEKVEELGLSSTAHFANCVGIYDEENVCTVYDMALILKAALENDLAREILTTKVRIIEPNKFHSEEMVLSNWFLRRIEDHVPEGLEVLAAKTGYVVEAGNCAASYAETADGGRYICVTGDASSSWQCIRDHVAIYEAYALKK